MNKKMLVTYLRLFLVATLLYGCSSGCSGGGSGGGTGSTACKDTGISYVGLDRQSSGSYIYNTSNVPDPLALCTSPHAVITKVTNNSGSNISIAHGGPGSGYINLNDGESTTGFNGQAVEGAWSAQRSGSVNDAPSQLTIKVEWQKQ